MSKLLATCKVTFIVVGSSGRKIIASAGAGVGLQIYDFQTLAVVELMVAATSERGTL